MLILSDPISALVWRVRPARRAALQCDRARLPRHRFFARLPLCREARRAVCQKKVVKQREDHDRRFRHADVKLRGHFYTIRNRQVKVQNYKIRLEGMCFLNCLVAVSGFTNLELGMALDESAYGVSNGSLVLNNENALGQGQERAFLSSLWSAG